MKTAIVRGHIGDPDREADTRATEAIKAQAATATNDTTEAKDVKKATEQRGDADKKVQYEPEEAGKAARAENNDSWK